MAALFLASFSLTWALQRPPEQSVMAPVYSQATVPAASSAEDPGIADAVPTAEQPEPTLDELAVHPDPGTSAEAQTLLALVHEEVNADQGLR